MIVLISQGGTPSTSIHQETTKELPPFSVSFNLDLSNSHTFKHGDQDHPLQLNYFLPYNNRRLKYNCDVCKEKLHPNYWVYNCEKCRYFVHIKCATSEPKRREITGEESFDDPNIMNFPIVGEPTDLLADILNKLNLVDDERVTEFIHFSHDHPLSLFDTQSNNGQMPNDKIATKSSPNNSTITNKATPSKTSNPKAPITCDGGGGGGGGSGEGVYLACHGVSTCRLVHALSIRCGQRGQEPTNAKAHVQTLRNIKVG
ncbi:hypothetical protein LguiA_021433 [Lonicera macranthoides]